MSGAIIEPVLNIMTGGFGVGQSQSSALMLHSIFIGLVSLLYGTVNDGTVPQKSLIFDLTLFGLSGTVG